MCKTTGSVGKVERGERGKIRNIKKSYVCTEQRLLVLNESMSVQDGYSGKTLDRLVVFKDRLLFAHVELIRFC